MKHLARLSILPVLALAACNSQPTTDHMAVLAQEQPDAGDNHATVLRISGTTLRFYRLPEFEDAGWSITDRTGDPARVVGFEQGDEQLFVFDRDSVLKAYDLRSGLVRQIDSSAILATVGPDGTPLIVHAGGSVGSVEQRRPSIWADSVAGQPTRIWGVLGRRLLTETVEADARVLRLFGDGRRPVRRVLPPGPMALTLWGELAAVATPNAIELYETRDADAEPRTIDVLEGPVGVAFSAAGHVIYVTTTLGRLLTYDRYTRALIDSSATPGSAGHMRAGRNGKFLFVREGDTDTVSVYDAMRKVFAHRIATLWTASTPSITADGSVLIKNGDDLITLNPETFEEIGRLRGGPDDLWAVANFDPVTPIAQQAEEVPEVEDGEEQSLYVQVSSSQNQVWAQDFANRLVRAGMEARVLEPTDDEELYRVVLGPYTNRAEAENAGRTLGRPYWIFDPETETKEP